MNPISDFKRIARLNHIIGHLIKIKTTLTVETFRLGYPVFTDGPECPTSMVGISEDGRIRYIWNREYFDNASNLAVQYICQHEALHIALRHLERRKDRDPQWWNIAADGIINSILDDFYDSVGYGNVLPAEYTSGVMYDPILGERVSNFKISALTNGEVSTAYNSTEQVYDALIKKFGKTPPNQVGQPQPGQGDGDGQGQGKGDGQGDNKDKDKQDQGQFGKMLDNHDGWDQQVNPETAQAIDTIREQAKEENESNQNRRGRRGRKAGNMPGLVSIELAKDYRVHVIPWQSLLRNRLASVRKPTDYESWARPHRKLYNQYPDIILPGPHEDEALTSLIFVAIDTSGSVGDDDIGELVEIVKTLPPDQYEVVKAWFDTVLYDCDDLSRPYGRGGTSFRAIESVISGKSDILVKGQNARDPSQQGKKIERYPDVVIVLTDGEASCPTPEFPERWVWILTKRGTSNYIQSLNPTVFQIGD